MTKLQTPKAVPSGRLKQFKADTTITKTRFFLAAIERAARKLRTILKTIQITAARSSHLKVEKII